MKGIQELDRISKQHRSWNMSRIRGRDTEPERLVRSALHRAGFRFRLYKDNLPGRPDVVLPKYMTVIFVHGCFWHRHQGCQFSYNPKTRITFWKAKFRANEMRDLKVRRILRRMGWRVVVFWECETRSKTVLLSRIRRLTRQIR